MRVAGESVDGHIKWKLLSALAMSNLVEQFDRYLFSVSRIPFVDTKSYEYALLAGTLFSVVYCIGNIFWSLLNDYIELDRVSVVALSCMLSSMALVCVPFCTTFTGQACLRLIMGFAQSPITSFCSSLIKDAFTNDERGVAFGVFDSGTFLGFAISLTLGTIMYDAYGWKVPYFVLGFSGIVYGVLLWFMKDPFMRSAGERAAATAAAAAVVVVTTSTTTALAAQSPRQGEQGVTSKIPDVVVVTTGARRIGKQAAVCNNTPAGDPVRDGTVTATTTAAETETEVETEAGANLSILDVTETESRGSVMSADEAPLRAGGQAEGRDTFVTDYSLSPARNTNSSSMRGGGGARDTGRSSLTHESRMPTFDRGREEAYKPVLPNSNTNPLLQPLGVRSMRGGDDMLYNPPDCAHAHTHHTARQHSGDRERLLSTQSGMSSLSQSTVGLSAGRLCSWVWRRVSRVLNFAIEYPSVLLMCLACGIRFCGGYQYAYYMSIYFSDTYEKQYDDGDEVGCKYSYADMDDGVNVGDSCDDENYPYCVDGVCNRLADSPWHNKGMAHSDFEKYFAGMTVLGSVTSCLVGGYVGDWVATYTSFELSGRLAVSGVALLMAAPCYYALYTLDFPDCFGMVALGGFFGEMYYGLVLATLAEMIPRKLFTISVAVYLSVLVAFGSNGTLLVPLLRGHFDDNQSLHHTFHNLLVAPTYDEFTQSGSMADVTVSERIAGATPLKYTMCWLVSGCYTIAGLLFLLAIKPVSRDMKRIREARANGHFVGLE
jgi:hypothetical protein